MKRRSLLSLTAGASLLAGGCAATKTPNTTAAAGAVQGTGDMGVVVERAAGALTLVNTSRRQAVGRVQGLGDLSHASVVFSRDARYAYVFGRDGGLTRVDLLEQRITHRVMQAGNSIGGAISADGSLVVAQNYQPGGIKVFDAHTLELLADVPATMPGGERSRVVGLADLPQQRFIYSLFDAEAICIADCSNPRQPRITTLQGIGRQPYDALLSPNGRH
ncbi:MAG: protein nirF, partial [Proteobacteria bacterium]|nr:protein nirF [Pseudomonadota bacterium]